MKSRWITLVLCLVVVAILVVRLRPPGSKRALNSANRSQPSSANVYLGLRNLVLQGTRANFGLGPGSRPTQPFAVVVDQGPPEGATTVIAIADGSASVYRSNGASSIGGGQSHESIRQAALKTVQVADEVQPLMHPATEFPLAQRGEISFYAVTDAGVYTATASVDDLASGRSPFSKLGDSAKAIVAAYGEAETKKTNSNP